MSGKLTDEEFRSLLKRLSKANSKYKKLLDEAENELIERYGYHPSDIDCDGWIDTYHQGEGSMTLKQIDTEMKLHIKMHS